MHYTWFCPWPVFGCSPVPDWPPSTLAPTGKAISLHSQIIKDFCKQIGVQTKQAQGLIRLAKKNGEWLGFLA